MNTIKQIIWTVLSIILAAVLSCNHSQIKDANKDDTEITRETTTISLQQQKDSIRKKLDVEAAKLDKRIQQIRDELAAARDNTKTMEQTPVEPWELRREVLQRKYKKLEQATSENWEDIKAEINTYIDSLKRADQQSKSGMKYKF